MKAAMAVGARRSQAVDVVFSVLLSSLAVFGFRTTFSGHEEIIVGLPAVLVGALVGFAILRLGLSLLPGLGLAVAAFLLFGGPVALRQTAIGGVLSSPATLRGLIDGGINGWVRLLTSVPPAGQAGNLLTVPYIAGFGGAVLAVVLAGTAPRLPLCLVPPFGVLVLAILFGTDRPASLLLQGAAFAAVGVAWLAMRGERSRRVVGSAGRPAKLRASRLLSALVVLLMAGAVGQGVGSRVSLGKSSNRYVLREQVEPPFDPRAYASPMAGYRLYGGQEAPLHDKTVLTVNGLPKGARLRLAVLDDYDNLVWRATGDGTANAGSFRRVGVRIPGEASGVAAKVEVEVGDLGGIWLPVVGSPEAISFRGPRAERLTDSFRYNRSAEAAAVPLALEKSDRYEIETRLPAEPDPKALEKASLDRRFSAGRVQVSNEVAGLLADTVANASKGSAGPYAQVAGVAAAFRDGAYSDGGKSRQPVVPPGHSLARLVRFLQAQQLVGNGEQYAAAMALALRSQEIPARVVMGFAPQATDGRVEVHGDDAAAWVEVPFDGFGWVAFDATPAKDREPRPEVQKRKDDQRAENQPPPPTTIPPPNVLSDDLKVDPRPPEPRRAGGRPLLFRMFITAAKLSLVPLVFVVLPAATLLAMKARRRKSRQRTGTPARRVAAAWSEVLDLARDMGHPVPPKSTRAEASRALGADGASEIAERADSVVFGSPEPTEADAQALWKSVGAHRASALGALPRVQRLLATLSLTSLRANR